MNWIDVRDRLPEINRPVKVIVGIPESAHQIEDEAIYDGKCWLTRSVYANVGGFMETELEVRQWGEL